MSGVYTLMTKKIATARARNVARPMRAIKKMDEFSAKITKK